MSLEWPDYENEMKKKAKARKSGDDFIVPDSDEEDMKDASYRATKRKQQGEKVLLSKKGLLTKATAFRSWSPVPGRSMSYLFSKWPRANELGSSSVSLPMKLKISVIDVPVSYLPPA